MGNSHDDEVLVQALAYSRSGYYVQADHLGDCWKKPDVIDGRRRCRPDVVAWKAGECIIVEVESFKSLAKEHTKNQVEIFEKFAQERPHTEFRLVVIYSSRFDRLPDMFHTTSFES